MIQQKAHEYANPRHKLSQCDRYRKTKNQGQHRHREKTLNHHATNEVETDKYTPVKTLLHLKNRPYRQNAQPFYEADVFLP